MNTKDLPTTAATVEAWLRADCQHVLDAKPGTVYYCENTYAFLFGAATVKLAEAHAEIARLRTKGAK